MRLRVSFVVEDEGAALETAAFQSDRVVISGLKGARHVLVRTPDLPNELELPKGLNSSVVMSWARSHPAQDSRLEQVFDQPSELGVRISTGPEVDWSTLQPWLDHVLPESERHHQPVDAESWQSWASPASGPFSEPPPALVAAFPFIDFSRAKALLLVLEPEGSRLEVWYPTQEWSDVVTRIGERTEVGILAVKGEDPGDIILVGRVRDLSKSRSEPVLFHVYPTYRPPPKNSRATARFVEPYGLHPTLELDIHTHPPLANCRLFAKLDLPESVFMDKYQMGDMVHVEPPAGIVGIWGETDLEAPVWAVQRGSLGLLWLQESVGRYHVPLHFRYQPPTPDLRVNGTMPAPVIFWSCPDPMLKTRDHDVWGVASAFPHEDTAFHILETQEVPFRVPAIGPAHEHFAHMATTVTVLLGTLFVLLAIIRRVVTTLRSPETSSIGEKKKFKAE